MDAPRRSGDDARAAARRQLRLTALRLLSQREWGVEQLRRRLAPLAQGLGVEADELSKLIDELAAAGWQSDARFAESLARRRAHFGTRRLEVELKASGVGTEIGQAAVAAARATEVERCRMAWQKKFGVAPASAAERARQARFLSARGFAASAIDQVLRGSIRDDE
jgi:regulatory protein